MPKRLALLGWLCVVVALLPLPVAAQDPCEQAGNLTYNCQFTSFGDAPGGQVAQGWWPFVISGHPAFDQSTESPLAPAQRVWSDGEGFVAGIYQTVTGLTPGATYQAYVGWFVFQSAGPEMGRSIGIDPNGGTDPNSAAIVWSPEVWEKKRLAPELLARAVAAGDKVTVFLRVNHPKTYGADQAFMDAVSLVRDDTVPVVGVEPAATATPPPTDTPAPTETPAVVDTATPEPAATPEPTATAAPAAAASATPEPAAEATNTPALSAAAAATPATAAATTPARSGASTQSTQSTQSTVSTVSTALPSATATVAAPPTPSALPTAAPTTVWDLRSGTGVAQLSAPAAAPQSLAVAVPDNSGHRPTWPYAVVALGSVSLALFGLFRSSTGGRKRG